METSSNWISKAKSANFLPSGTFIQKSWGKTEKMEKRPKSTKNDQK